MPVRDRDMGWNRIVRNATRPRAPTVKVGIFGGLASASKRKRQGGVVAGKTVYDIGVIHEFGTADIPRRSFIRDTVTRKRTAIIRKQRNLYAAVLDGRTTEHRALEALGLYVQGQIRQRISSNIPPPLSERTKARKGSDVALIDTGQLRASIDYEVEG